MTIWKVADNSLCQSLSTPYFEGRMSRRYSECTAFSGVLPLAFVFLFSSPIQTPCERIPAGSNLN